MKELLQELKAAYGEDAEFRDGQEEAIQGVLEGKRTLVVQEAGWGKSLVYFFATKIIRKRTQGITLIISPLLALMNNQIDSAEKLGLHVETINSENSKEWYELHDRAGVGGKQLINQPRHSAHLRRKQKNVKD